MILFPLYHDECSYNHPRVSLKRHDVLCFLPVLEFTWPEAAAMIDLAQQEGRKIRGSIQCSFGCVHECEIEVSQVQRLAKKLLNKGVDRLVLADTTGMATPPAVRQNLAAILPMAGDVPFGLHLHDTRGMGLVNLMAAL